jgi:GntR family transcriptional regulator
MAIQEMVNAGQLEKKHGKGTFLAFPSMQIDINKFISFSSTAALMGLPHESRIIRFERISEYTDDIAKNLQLSDKEEVYELVRLRLLDGEISLLDHTYLPAKLFPNLSKEMFAKDGLYTICDAYGYYFMTGKESFIPYKIGLEESILLECEEGDPAIMLVKVMSHYNQRIEYTKGLFKKSKFELTASIVKINV